MKKKNCMMILVCCILLCAGCSTDGDTGNFIKIEGQEINVGQGDDSKPGNILPNDSAQNNSGSSQEQNGDNKPIYSASVQSELNQFQGLDEIQYAGGDRILLFADKIYLYELTGQRVVAETEYPDSNGRYGNLKTWITDSGYCIAYEVFTENQETQMVESQSMGFGGGEDASVGSSHIMYAYYIRTLTFKKP